MVIGVAAEDAERAQTILRNAGETVWTLGRIAGVAQDEPFVEFQA